MWHQMNISNSIREIIYIDDDDPSDTNLGSIQPNPIPVARPGLMRDIDQSLNRGNPENPIVEHGWLPSAGAEAGTDLTLEMRPYVPNNVSHPPSIDSRITNGPIGNGISTLRGASSHAIPQNIDLNAEYEDGSKLGDQDIGVDLSLHTPRQGISAINQIQLTSNSSNFPVISSETAGNGAELRVSRLSSDGQHLLCKRKAPENASVHLSLGESSGSAQQAVSAQYSASSNLNMSSPMSNPSNAMHTEQLNTGLGVGIGVTTSNVHQISSVAGNPVTSQRNIRFRVENQENSVPATISPYRAHIWTSPGLPRPTPPVVFSLNASTGANMTPEAPPVMHVSNYSRAQQSSPWNYAGNSRGIESSMSSFNAFNGGNALPGEGNSRNFPQNIFEYNMLLHENERRSSASNPSTNWNTAITLNPPGSTSGVHISPPPALLPQQNFASQYEQRISEIIQRSAAPSAITVHGGHIGNNLSYSNAPSGMQGLSSPAGGGNARPPRLVLHRGSLARILRHAHLYLRLSPEQWDMGNRMTAGRISELRYIVECLRRGEIPQEEEFMIIERPPRRSRLYRVREVDNHADAHEDMRLDIDNMSYEELLELEERIGIVCSGLTEDYILSHLKCEKYYSMKIGPPVVDETCCICQEEYIDGEDLGKLGCGHKFHANCVSKWLVVKNNCPICKALAL